MSDVNDPEYLSVAMYLAGTRDKAVDLARSLDLYFDIELFVTPESRTIQGTKVDYLFFTEEVRDTVAAVEAHVTTLQSSGISMLVLGSAR